MKRIIYFVDNDILFERSAKCALAFMLILGSIVLVSCGPRIKPGADLRGEDFSGKDLRDVDFADVNLSDANLSGSDLAGVDLTTTILVGVNLSRVNLSGADLSGVDLTNANLTGADLSNANLSGGKLDLADLSDAKGVTDEMLNSLSSWNGARLESRAVIQVALAEVCKSKNGIPQAAQYTESEGLHPIVLLSLSGSSHEWSDRLPENWDPLGIRFVELVLCVGDEVERLIETCEYAPPPDIKRYKYEIMLRLLSARTGELIEKVTLRGSEPRECAQTEISSVTRLTGSHVSFDQVQNWVKRYVEP